MPANYVLLERIELGTAVTSITFSNIPQSGYTDLKITASTLDNAEDWLEVQFNGVTSGNNMRFVRGNGTTVATSTLTWFNTGVGNSSTTSNTFANCELYINNYAVNGVIKSGITTWASEANATANYMGLGANISSITAPITSIKISQTPN